MKKLLLLISIAIGINCMSIAQQWTANLQSKKAKSELTLKDYQKAFNEYWEPYDLDKGYFIDSEGNRQKARGWKQFKRWEYYWETQVDAKTGAFPKNTAYQELQIFNSKKSNPKTSSEWVNLGTNSSSGGYAGIGRINCVEFHPTNNDTYWVGTPAGGLWVTYNNGENWTVLTDDNSVLGVSDIVIPSDYETSKTIYIATGDRDASDNRSIGVLKSIDNGATWKATDLSFTVQQNEMTTRLLLDPENDNTIIAATTDGVYKTTDGGSTWSNKLTSLSFIDMEYMPGDYNTLYGSTEYGEIHYSYNAGETWTKVLSAQSRVELAVTPADSSYVYAIAAASNNGLDAIYKSTNCGENFTKVFSGSTKNLLGWSSDGSGSGGQGWYDLAIATSPVNRDIVVVGGVNSWRSLNGGSTFSCINHWWGDGVPAVHADKHMLTYRKNGDLFECNDGGIYLSEDDGTSWRDKTNGIVNSQMYKLGVSQLSENEVITGLQDNGSKLYTNNQWWDVKGGDGMECLIDYTNDDIQYATYVNGQISRTKNHWNSATDIEPSNAGDGAWVTPYIIDPVDNNTLYAGYSDVWKTTNQGDSWEKISNLYISGKIRSMAIAPSDNNILYIGGRYELHKTTNGGDTWEEITTGLPSNFITYIAVKNNDPNTIWVTLGSYDNKAVYESSDGGSTWKNISEGLPEIPANSIVQDKNYASEDILYVGTEAGVFFKKEDNPWVFYSNGLPNVKIGELEIYYNEDITKCKLRAATYGRGLWETALVIPELPKVEELMIDSVQSNSAYASASIGISESFLPFESGFVYSKYSNVEITSTKAFKVSTNPNVNEGIFGIKITDLDASSYYYIRAYAINEVGVAYSDELSFVTDCNGAVAYLPYIQEFSADSLPACWFNVNNSENDMLWDFNNKGSVNFNSTTSDNGFAILNSEYYGEDNSQNADLLTPIFDFTSFDKVNLSFEHYFKHADGTKASFLYTIDNGTNWEVIEEWTETIGKPEAAAYFAKDISSLVAGETQVQFKWNFTGSNSGFWCVDDVLVDSLFTVLFKVSYKEEELIENAIVELNNIKLKTNFSGESFFRSVSGTTLDFEVDHDYYESVDGNITLNSNIIENVIFNKSSDARLKDLMLDSLTIDGFSPEITEYFVQLAIGEDFPEVVSVPNREVDYLFVSQPTLDKMFSKTRVIAEDGKTDLRYYVYFEFEPTYNVTFDIAQTNSEKVSEAAVSFMDSTKTTNQDGVVLFYGVPARTDVPYSIAKEGFNNYNGKVSIVDENVVENVVIYLVSLNDGENLSIKLYPNPTKRLLNITLLTEIKNVEFALVDINGRIVLEQKINSNKEQIDLMENAKGVYFVHLTVNNKKYVEKIILE